MIKKIIRRNAHFEMWGDDRGYTCFFKYAPSGFGEYQWNVMHSKSGKGKGGFAMDADEAKECIEAQVQAFEAEKENRA